MTGTLFGSLTIENEQPVLLLAGRMFRARLFAEHQQTTLSNAYIQHASMHLYNSFCPSKPNDESQHVHIQLCYTSPWTLRFTACIRRSVYSSRSWRKAEGDSVTRLPIQFNDIYPWRQSGTAVRGQRSTRTSIKQLCKVWRQVRQTTAGRVPGVTRCEPVPPSNTPFACHIFFRTLHTTS